MSSREISMIKTTHDDEQRTDMADLFTDTFNAFSLFSLSEYEFRIGRNKSKAPTHSTLYLLF